MIVWGRWEGGGGVRMSDVVCDGDEGDKERQGKSINHLSTFYTMHI